MKKRICLMIMTVLLVLSGCSDEKTDHQRFGEETIVVNGYEYPSVLGERKLTDEEISEINSSDKNAVITTYIDSLLYFEAKKNDAATSKSFVNMICWSLAGDYEDIKAIEVKDGTEEYRLLCIKTDGRYYVLDPYRQYKEKAVWLAGYEGDKWSFDSIDDMLETIDACYPSDNEVESKVLPSDASGTMLKEYEKWGIDCYYYEQYVFPDAIGFPRLTKEEIDQIDETNESDVISTYPDMICYLKRKGFLGVPSENIQKGINILLGDYEEIGTITVYFKKSDYDLLYVKANGSYYPLDLSFNLLDQKDWMESLDAEECSFDDLDHLLDTIVEHYTNETLGRPGEGSGKAVSATARSVEFLGKVEAPNGTIMNLEQLHGEKIFNYSGTQIPLGLGLPVLTSEQIEELINEQDFNKTRETITTLADAVCYLFKSGFKEGGEINSGRFAGTDVGNIEFAGDHLLYTVSGEEMMSIKEGQCSAMCTLNHYLLRDDYDELGYIKLSYTDNDGHAMVYIKKDGKYYLINPADYVFAKGPYGNYVEAFDGWLSYYKEDEPGSADSLEELMNNMINNRIAPGGTISKLITLDYDGVFCNGPSSGGINRLGVTVLFPKGSNVKAWTDNTPIDYVEPEHSTSQTNISGIADLFND